MKNHSAPKTDVTFKCKICYHEFPGFRALCQKNTQHGFLIKTTNVDPDEIINEDDCTNLEEELLSCPHLLVDFELEKARHKHFNNAVENLNPKLVDEKFVIFSSKT